MLPFLVLCLDLEERGRETLWRCDSAVFPEGVLYSYREDDNIRGRGGGGGDSPVGGAVEKSL